MNVISTATAALAAAIFLASVSSFVSAFAFVAPRCHASAPPRRSAAPAPATAATTTAIGQSTETASSETSSSDMHFASSSSGGGGGGASSSSSSSSSVYDKLGFTKDEIALGVEAEEVLKWVGTRDDLVTKVENDNPKFDRARAEQEVTKFMLDAEMVSAYIAFEKRKSDPKTIRAEAEQTLTDPSTWATYAAWIGGGAGFATLKNLYIEPKYASGEWTDLHIALPGADMFHHAADSATVAADAAQHVVSPDAVQSTLEGVAAAVNNAVTCVGDSCP